MRICISSLKFSPGHISHIKAYVKLFEELGAQVYLLLNKGYLRYFSPTDIYNKVYTTLDDVPAVDYVLFWNVSPSNPTAARYFKKHGSKVLYMLHEPRDRVSEYLKEGFKQTIKALMAHELTKTVLRISDGVIVSSEYALKLYEENDAKYARCPVLKIPLLFDDELIRNVPLSEKKYFSYIGHAVKGHAFDEFLRLIAFLYESKVDMKFQISTRTDISSFLRSYRRINKMIEDGILVVNHGRVLSNEEINSAYAKSFCVWNIYNRTTQSGVLPKAFMFGSPVIANNIGSFPEFVKDGVNGYLLRNEDERYDYELIKSKLENLQEKLPYFTSNARRSFEEVFYYKNYVSTVKLFLCSL